MAVAVEQRPFPVFAPLGDVIVHDTTSGACLCPHAAGCPSF